MRLAGGLLVLALGCGAQAKPAARPADPSTPYGQLEARMPAVLGALVRLGQSIRAAAGDCPGLARALRSFSSVHGAEVSELATLMSRLTPAERERFDYDHADDRDTVTGTVREITAACPDDAEVRGALVTAGFRTK